MTVLPPGFHAHSGVFFLRLENGSVRVTADGKVYDFDGGTWGSILASVSYRGETSESWNEAMLFHGGPVQTVAPNG